MELTMNMSAFEQLDSRDMMEVDGGSAASATVFVIGGAIVAGILAPVTCGGSVGAYVAGVTAGLTLMVNGLQEACGG